MRERVARKKVDSRQLTVDCFGKGKAKRRVHTEFAEAEHRGHKEEKTKKRDSSRKGGVWGTRLFERGVARCSG
jgi:hypothetical protein